MEKCNIALYSMVGLNTEYSICYCRVWYEYGSGAPGLS